MEAELGYGMSAMGERGVVTPYSTLAVSDDGARDYRVGGRLEIGESLAVGIEGERRESGTDGAGYGEKWTPKTGQRLKCVPAVE